jgi:hypothetical protein
MNKQFGRLLAAGICGLIVASAARAQDSPRPSHRLLDTDFGNLSQAESLLARRLGHTEDLRKLQDLVKGLDKVSPKELKEYQDVIKNHPEFLDDPNLQGLLSEAEKFKQNDGAALSQETKDKLARQAKQFLDKLKSQDSSSDNPVTSVSPDVTHPTLDQPDLPKPPPPPIVPKPAGVRGDIEHGMTELMKKIDSSPEGESLRKAFISDLAKPDGGLSHSSPALSEFLQNLITPRQAAWLNRNLKLPSLPNFDGWSSSPNLSAVPSVGGASSVGGGLEGGVWVVVLALFGVAAWLALRAAKRQADGARAKAWSAGPWPVHPSRVSTREDLIRAFEHLAFLCLGPTARHLNHLDVASRLGETDDGRAGPAARLAHLYEQARYAPPDELLPANELAAARGDLSTLAGAAA